MTNHQSNKDMDRPVKNPSKNNNPTGRNQYTKDRDMNRTSESRESR